MDYFTKKEGIVILGVVFIIVSVVVFKMSFKNPSKAENNSLNFISPVIIEEENNEI